MSFNDFMTKVRYWDNKCAKWMMRHFYIMFFEFVLVVIFFFFFFNTLKTIDIGNHIQDNDLIKQLMLQQTTLTTIIVILMLLNSFWMLYIFNSMSRISVLMKDLSFNLMRRRHTPQNKN